MANSGQLSVPEQRRQAAQLMRDGLSAELSLVGRYAALEPLQVEHDAELLEAAADGALWDLHFTSVPSRDTFHDYLSQALENRQQGTELPFVIRRLSDNKIVGSTRYYRINPAHRNLSIGYTWYSASAQRTAINTECKSMLLTHAFEVLGCIAVMWHTHQDNVRSQTAIQRLGAKHDGILRADMILADGSVRDTYCYSMLRSEWPASQLFLSQRLAT